jgi:hydroxymethylbilane synthase
VSASALTIGTRASALALWQAQHVAQLISAQPGAPQVALQHISTQGDLQQEVPLWQVGGRAFFTREIDRALLSGSVSLAVHSLKDLPTRLEPGLVLAATLRRVDPRDVLVSRHGEPLERLPRAPRIGTSSLRRRALLARARPDAVLLELRGNVPTRLERVQRGDYDAVVLAAAGLERLGLLEHASEYLDPERFPPAVAQGVIGVCAREGDRATLRWLVGLDDPPSRLAAQAERALLARLEGGCQVPLGALATVADGSISLRAQVCALDGGRTLAAQGTAAATHAGAQALGTRLAEELLAGGAARLIGELRAAAPVAPP